MDLREFLAILLKRWLTVLLCLIAGAGAGVGATALMTPQYQATAEVYVSVRSPDTSSTSDILQGSNYARNTVPSYVQIITKDIVLTKVIAQLKLDLTVAQLASKVKAQSPTGTVLIDITVVDTDPQRAADIANTTARVLKTVVENTLEKPETGKEGMFKVTQTQEAAAPVIPTSPKLSLNLAVGLVMGLALGVGLAWLMSILDTRIHSTDELRAVTGAPLLGTIPLDPDAATRPLVVYDDPQSPAAEEYRSLRTNVAFTAVGGQGRCLVMSSANPAEGKSTTVANLAIALADSFARVALIDCDFRRPAIARYMRVEGGAGLSDVLVGRAQPVEVLQRWGSDNLYVLAAGRTPPNPSELLGSHIMQELIEFLLKTFDYILLDSPPLLVATDAAVLSKLANGVILVASHETTRRPPLFAAVNSLHAVGSHLVGTIMTKVPPKRIGSYRYGYGGYGYGYGYGYGSESAPKGAARGSAQSSSSAPRLDATE